MQEFHRRSRLDRKKSGFSSSRFGTVFSGTLIRTPRCAVAPPELLSIYEGVGLCRGKKKHQQFDAQIPADCDCLIDGTQRTTDN
jgi:hypothetical protein